MREVFIVAVSLFFILEGFSQGKIDGFYRGKGNVTTTLGFGFEDSKNYYAGTEKEDLSRNLYYGNIYGAFGITDNFDISASIPYLSSNENSDFQDILLFLKYRIYQRDLENGNLQLSLATGFSTPMSNYSIGGLNDIGQQATVFEERVVVHYHWNNGWFATLQSGFSFKLEEVPNSIPFVLKAGKATTDWYYDFYYDYQHSFGGIDYLGTPSPQNFKEFGVDYHKLGGTLYRSFSEKIGAYFSLAYVLSGRNVFQGAGYGLGLVYNF